MYGYGVTEDILRSQFTPYGPIVNISMEVEKNCGFITYEKVGRVKKNPACGSRLDPDIDRIWIADPGPNLDGFSKVKMVSKNGKC